MASKFDVERLKGIVVPIITPVTDAYDGKIDIARLCDQVDYVIEHDKAQLQTWVQSSSTVSTASWRSDPTPSSKCSTTTR